MAEKVLTIHHDREKKKGVVFASHNLLPTDVAIMSIDKTRDINQTVKI